MGMSCETHRVSRMQMLTRMFACKLETVPGVHGGKDNAGFHVIMKFCRDEERNIFSLFLYWKIQKNTKQCKKHP